MIQAYEKLCVEKTDLESELGEMVGPRENSDLGVFAFGVCLWLHVCTCTCILCVLISGVHNSWRISMLEESRC